MMRVLGLIPILGLVVTGANMLLRPASYIGPGALQASDPRTVRAFGKIFVGMGVVPLALILLSLLFGGTR